MYWPSIPHTDEIKLQALVLLICFAHLDLVRQFRFIQLVVALPQLADLSHSSLTRAQGILGQYI